MSVFDSRGKSLPNFFYSGGNQIGRITGEWVCVPNRRGPQRLLLTQTLSKPLNTFFVKKNTDFQLL